MLGKIFFFKQGCTWFTHTRTPSPRAPFPPLIPAILPLLSLIKGHLLSFLSASPPFPSISDWWISASLWLATAFSSSPQSLSWRHLPFFIWHSSFLWVQPPWLTLRLLLSAPPSVYEKKKGVRVPPGGWNFLELDSCCLKTSAILH